VYGRVVVAWIFVGLEPAGDSDVIGTLDSSPVPWVGNPVDILPGKMVLEENALSGCWNIEDTEPRSIFERIRNFFRK
jgi:hypothetical protein